MRLSTPSIPARRFDFTVPIVRSARPFPCGEYGTLCVSATFIRLQVAAQFALRNAGSLSERTPLKLMFRELSALPHFVQTWYVDVETKTTS